ncbi:MAG: hypothetical protein CM15mP121_2040 [Bacteroidota bacterium]|nr:MAG: hypothetical protein CM15mP121_2040 [Bacteroidota bacterium]
MVLDCNEVGTYEVIYTATDSSGKTSSETRTVLCKTHPPILILWQWSSYILIY